MQKKLETKVTPLLEDAEQSAQQEKREKAYRSSLEATNLSPDDHLAWYLRSQTAPSAEEQLMCLSRTYSLNPAFPDAKEELHAAVQDLLDREPFLAYVHETEHLYQVRSGRDLLINIPKNRVFEKPHLQKDWGPLKPAFVWLSFSLVALFLGGVGAFVIAPIAALQALRLQLLPLSQSDRLRLWIVLAISMLTWFASIPLSLLFLIRFFS